jgi:ABC-type transport system involved in cytochrome c biogenesis permease subunit
LRPHIDAFWGNTATAFDVAPDVALGGPLYAALACYGGAFVVSLVRPRIGRWLLGTGVAVHFAATLAVVTLASWKEVRLYVVPLLALVCAALVTAVSFPLGLSFPPPLMQTIWYPLHVPLSFLAYATWAAAAAAGGVWFRERDPLWLARVDGLALNGFALWSVSMICGGIWGVVAWGAYFMWDVKIIWSVILWFHYASFVHLRLTPSLLPRKWIRPALAIVGLVWVFVAYVGTSFFFGRSSHAF